jgi:integrase
LWKAQRGTQLVGARDNRYRLVTICAIVLPSSNEPFGNKPLQAITTGDIESLRLAESSRSGDSDRESRSETPAEDVRVGGAPRIQRHDTVKIGTETAIRLEKEIPRNRRFEREDDEQRLLDAANPHLRAIITALLDTAGRPGELLSLQWKDVNFTRREMTIRGEKAKTRTTRLVPISTRLGSILEMRRLDANAEPFPPQGYVFGDTTGRRLKSVRTAWENG